MFDMFGVIILQCVALACLLNGANSALYEDLGLGDLETLNVPTNPEEQQSDQQTADIVLQRCNVDQAIPCANGGECYYHTKFKRPLCVCPPEYSGDLCLRRSSSMKINQSPIDGPVVVPNIDSDKTLVGVSDDKADQFVNGDNDNVMEERDDVETVEESVDTSGPKVVTADTRADDWSDDTEVEGPDFFTDTEMQEVDKVRDAEEAAGGSRSPRSRRRQLLDEAMRGVADPAEDNPHRRRLDFDVLPCRPETGATYCYNGGTCGEVWLGGSVPVRSCTCRDGFDGERCELTVAVDE